VSQDLEALRAGFEAFWEHADWSAVDTLPDDFVSVCDFSFAFNAAGREEFTKVFRDLRETFPDNFSNNRFEDLGPGLVLVEVETGGHGATSGIEAKMEFVQLWRIEDGVARSVHWYRTREEALAATAGS
jgi:ketosteroid isomerase-like protein